MTEQKVEKKQEHRVGTLMHWIRVILPIALAVLGWFVGQTVGNFERRVTELEINQRHHQIEYAAHTARNTERFLNAERRISVLELSESNLISANEFLSKLQEVDRRLERIEKRQDQKKQ